MKPTAVTSLAIAGTLLLTSCASNPFADDAPEDSDDGTVAEAEVPSLGEIQDEMWETMLAAETVTIEGQVEAGEADLDELFEQIDEDAVGDITITGALDGTDSEMSYAAGEGNTFTQRAVGGVEYFRGEDFGALLYGNLDDDVAAAVEPEFIEDLVADQWVEFSADGSASIFSAEDFLGIWQRELREEDTDAISGVRETRDGQEVYVYAQQDGETEYVVAADGQPHLLELRDEDSTYTFTDWNSADIPEEPENVITLDDIFDAIADHQGWPTEEDVSDQ
ncbi:MULTISPECIES: hypothetical protein [Actinomycetes]|uniref:DUF2092 domain-containing protein n=2 Tax=Actinomycetes TaxID=1760 RepID=A0ABP6M1N9_9MICC|nr:MULTISPECIES: hypothetical protein [unclassified Nesterenkonia]MDS2173780.1 hypothetical protein [Nesterenkonia sp. CL21]OSM44319.1 hypothetical protein BCY76_003050 [Nesterenkonia sp. PF2B19]